MNKKLRKVIIILLILVVIGVSLFFIIRNKLKPVVNDYTVQGDSISQENEEIETSDEDEGSSAEESEESTSKLSSLVKVIGEENANNVNAGIVSLQTNSDSTISMTLNSTGAPEFEDYEKGDIFILDGNEQTPFKEVYIGKIVSKTTDSSGNLIVKTENPTLDEVFDEVHINETTLLSEENVNNINTIDGVNVRFVDDLETEMTNLNNIESTDYTVTYLDEINYDDIETVQTDNLNFEGKSLVIDFDTGVEFDLNKKEVTTKAVADISNEVISDIELNSSVKQGEEKPAATQEGDESDSTQEESSANQGGPIQAESEGSLESSSKISLGLSGKIGVENLSSKINLDFNIFEGGMRDLSWEFGGKAIANVELYGKYKGTLGGKETSAVLGDKDIAAIKCSGLSKKAFPIAYIDFTGTPLYFDQVYSGIEFMPVSCGLMIYSDVEGNITVSVSAGMNYSREFNYKLTVFEDGKLCSDMLESSSTESGSLELNFSAKIYTDITCLGFSGLITIANVNVLELGLIDIGAEAEAEFTATSVSNMVQAEDGSYNWVKDEENSKIEADGYIRGYFKALEIRIRMKFATEGLIADWGFELSKDFTYNFTLIDLTIFQLGEKTETTYDPGTMEYSLVTAKDSDFEYYKEYSEKTSESKLIKRNEALQTEELETDGDFIGICGIDIGYVYIFKTGKSGGYDIYRVAKDGISEKNKIILSGVDTILLEDETYFYYVDKDEINKVQMIDRSTLEDKTLQTFDKGIKPFYMADTGTAFYVACEDTEDNISWLFGEAVVEYYYINESSEDPLIAENLFTRPGKFSYSISTTIVDKTLLRGTSSAYYMNTPAGSIQIETTVGWNELEDGVFTVEELDGVNTMYLYSASDGSKKTLVQVNNGNALWTVIKGNDGYYYFLDQAESGVGLYKLDIGTSTKTLVKEYNEFSINLESCGVASLGSTLFFYEMPNDNTLNVKYRYTIY